MRPNSIQSQGADIDLLLNYVQDTKNKILIFQTILKTNRNEIQ